MTGRFRTSATDYRLRLFGLPLEVVSLKVDGRETEFSQLPDRGVIVEIPLDFEEVEVLF